MSAASVFRHRPPRPCRRVFVAAPVPSRAHGSPPHPPRSCQNAYDADPCASSAPSASGGGGGEGAEGDAEGRPSPYAGGLFRVQIKLEKDYPMSAPKVRAWWAAVGFASPVHAVVGNVMCGAMSHVVEGLPCCFWAPLSLLLLHPPRREGGRCCKLVFVFTALLLRALLPSPDCVQHQGVASQRRL